MKFYTFFNEIVFAALEGFMIILLVLVLTNRKKYLNDEIIRITLFVALYTIFSYFASYYIPMGYHTVLIGVFAIVILALTSRLGIRNATISFATTLVFFIITEFPTVFLFSATTGINITDIVNDPFQKLILSIFVKGIQLVIIYILIKSDKAFVRSLSNEEKNNIIPYFLFGICLMSIFVFNINYAIGSGENIFIYELLLLAILLLYVFLGFKIIQEKEQLLKIQHKYNLQEAYVKNIETILNIVRREKHDFANHINTIHAICTLNRPDALDKIKAYIDRVAHNLQSAYHYYNTGNDYVDGLLAVKSNYAFDHNIHFEVDFEALLENTSVDSYDLISILGNIIDNAFEALNQQIDLKQKIVSVSAYEEKDKYYLSIANNGPIIPKENIDLIFSNGYSTKEVDKQDHGLGLFIVNQLILKNNGNVVVTSTEEETEFLICFDGWKGKNGEISTESYELNSL